MVGALQCPSSTPTLKPRRRSGLKLSPVDRQATKCLRNTGYGGDAAAEEEASISAPFWTQERSSSTDIGVGLPSRASVSFRSRCSQLSVSPSSNRRSFSPGLGRQEEEEDNRVSSPIASFRSRCSQLSVSPSHRRSFSPSLGRQEESCVSSPISIGPPPTPSMSPSRTAGMAWVRGKCLGAGASGTVCKAIDPTTSRIFAVKEVALGDSSPEAARRRERLAVELSIYQAFEHPNLVSYLGSDYTDASAFIYLEYVPGGSIASMLRDFGAFEIGAIRKAARGILEGLDYLHTRSPPVVHRDLKGENVLVNFDFTVKLTDFGCSKWSSETKSFTTLGSMPWMAPEVFTTVEGYGRKADIWSFGCTVIEMATAQTPWGNGAFDNFFFALNRIANSDETPPLPEHAPAECCDLIAWCTRRSQGQRPSAAEVLQHEFFVAADDDDGPEDSVAEWEGVRERCSLDRGV